MFNLVKANLYRLKKNKRYAGAIILMYLIGIIGGISMITLSIHKDDQLILINGIERLIMSCCLVVLPICYINFFFKRDDQGLNKKDLIIVKNRWKMIIADGITILISTIAVVYLFLIILYFILLIFGVHKFFHFYDVIKMGINITLLITALTDFAMMFEYWLGSFLLPVILEILIITGNMHLIVKFILSLIGYGRFAMYTLSGIAVYYEYRQLTYILLIIYMLIYKTISVIIVSRKEY